MTTLKFFLPTAVVAVLAGQEGAPLKLVPSEPLHAVRPPTQPEPQTAPTGVRPAILTLKPPSDPIYLVEESATDENRDKWRTYQRPKVDRFSRNADGIAIQGFDVVSYIEQRAEKGVKEHSFDYGGVTWQFSTADHLNQFRQDPERFAPTYGGFCSYSVGRGYPASADPRAYVIDGGKLYLFFNKAVQTVWEQDRGRLIGAAERNWPKLHR